MAEIMLTGASGRIAQALRPALHERGRAVRLFSRSAVGPLADNETLHRGRLEDLDSVVAATLGAEVVVHLGGISDEAPWDRLVEANVSGTYNVFEAARRCGIRRVVYASTHHVTGYYPTGVAVDTASPPRPDTLYAVSKVFGESLARLYHDKWGIEAVCLRIGACRPEPESADHLRTWLSTSDAVRLLLDAITAEVPGGFAIAYGASGNARSFWSTDESRALGFAPQDSADDFAERFPDRDTFSSPWQGAGYTAPGYRGR